MDTIDVKLMKQIRHDEGRSPCVYKDSLGYWTIADGILVDPSVPGAGLRDEEMDFITANRLRLARNDVLALLPLEYFGRLNTVRQNVLINMAYNMGRDRLSKFVNLFAMLRKGDYVAASIAMKESRWYHQTGDRAHRLVKEMETGTEQP